MTAGESKDHLCNTQPGQVGDDASHAGSPPEESRSIDPDPPTGIARSMARWFGVPLLILTIIVGGAIVVVLLFGSLATEGERSLDELLTLVESEGGEKVLGMALMPQDKEVWQAARELSMRLEQPEAELAPHELDAVVARLSGLTDRLLEKSEKLGESGLQKLEYVLSAPAKTRSLEAVKPLERCLASPRWQVRRQALQALGTMHGNPRVGKRVVGRIGVILREDPDPVVRTVAAYVLSFLGDPADPAVITGLTRACRDDQEDREVVWNAALSLARLGSVAGKGQLLDMLDRVYWEKSVTVRTMLKSGQVLEKPMSLPRVESHLMTAIDAVSRLDDPQLWRAVAALEEDSSAKVVGKVRQVLAERKEPVAPAK